MLVSYRYLLIIVLVAALLCLMPARGADAPNEKKPQTAAAQSVESAEAPAGADLSAQTNRETYLPCPLHWVLRGGEDGLLAVWQNTTGEALSVVRKTDIPVTAAAEEEQDELRDGRMFDDVQALEGYLESLSS